MRDGLVRLGSLGLVALIMSGGATTGCVRDGVVNSRRGRAGQSVADGRAEAAVGAVSVSAPMFSPIEDPVLGEDRLDFGPMKAEAALAAAIRRPTVVAERKRFSDKFFKLLVKATGASLDNSDDFTKTQKSSVTDAKPAEEEINEERKVTRKRTFKTPTATVDDIPTREKAPGEDEALGELRELLDGVDNADLAVPPDELATLIAAYKTYMVNLEQFHNVEGYDYARGLDHDYVPYRVHFTVTAQPGWYTRWYQYDAVAELTFGSPCGAGEKPEIIVLGVTPGETAQTVSDFTAALDQTRIALSGEGTFKGVAAAGKFESLVALAERLRGLRSDKILTVAFEGSNKIKIRFQPRQVADLDARRDEDSISRMLTATVLVRGAPTSGEAAALTVKEAYKPTVTSTRARATASVQATKRLLEESAQLVAVQEDNRAAIGRLMREMKRELVTYKSEIGEYGDRLPSLRGSPLRSPVPSDYGADRVLGALRGPEADLVRLLYDAYLDDSDDRRGVGSRKSERWIGRLRDDLQRLVSESPVRASPTDDSEARTAKAAYALADAGLASAREHVDRLTSEIRALEASVESDVRLRADALARLIAGKGEEGARLALDHVERAIATARSRLDSAKTERRAAEASVSDALLGLERAAATVESLPVRQDATAESSEWAKSLLALVNNCEASMRRFATNTFDRADLERRMRAFAVPVPPSGRPCTGSVSSYFVPSTWDSDGRRRPPRESPFGSSRPTDLLRDKTSASWTSWMPPWLGDIRRQLEIVGEPDGYYRLHLGALQKQLAELADAESAYSKAAARQKKLSDAAQTAKDAAATAASDVATKTASLEGAKAKQKALTEVVAAGNKDPATITALADAAAATGAAQAAADAAKAKSIASDAEAAAATKAASDAEPSLKPLAEARDAARTALFTARADATTAGRVELRLKVRAPKEAMLEDGRRVPLVVLARVVGLTDCSTRDRGCPVDAPEPTRLRDMQAAGYFGGTLELDNVDLSGAFSTPDAPVASPDEFLNLGATVEVKLWRPDVGRACDGNYVAGGFVGSTTERVVLRPWHRPIPDSLMKDAAAAARK